MHPEKPRDIGCRETKVEQPSNGGRDGLWDGHCSSPRFWHLRDNVVMLSGYQFKPYWRWLLARLFKAQSEAYLGSVTRRRGTSQKAPYSAGTGTKRRAAQDEYRTLGDATILSLSISMSRGPAIRNPFRDLIARRPERPQSTRAKRIPAEVVAICVWDRSALLESGH